MPGIGLVTDGLAPWLGFGTCGSSRRSGQAGPVLFAADLLARRADRMRDTRFIVPVARRSLGISALLIEAAGHGHDDRDLRASPSPSCSCRHADRTLLKVARRLRRLGAVVLGIVAPYRRDRSCSLPQPAGPPVRHRLPGRPVAIGLGTGHLVRPRPRGRPGRRPAILPNAHTDFIFAVIGEELGFVGCVVVVGLFFAFAMLGIRAAMRAPDRFGTLLAAGITAWIVVQASSTSAPSSACCR